MILVRYADDYVMGFEHREEAEQFLVLLRQRMAKFGLEPLTHVEFRPVLINADEGFLSQILCVGFVLQGVNQISVIAQTRLPRSPQQQFAGGVGRT